MLPSIVDLVVAKIGSALVRKEITTKDKKGLGI